MRTPECHGTCEAYQAFRKEREKIYLERLQRQTVQDFRDAGYYREMHRRTSRRGNNEQAKGNGVQEPGITERRMTMEKALLKIAEASELLGVNRRTVDM